MNEAPARRTHWDARYADVGAASVSWFEPEPAQSLALIDLVGADPAGGAVDVGGGASRLVDALLGRGWDDVTVVDVSQVALGVSRQRLGPRADTVAWVAADVLAWEPGRTFALWHDRAVFHFLVEEDERERYRAVLLSALAPGGVVVVGTFSPDGPTSCSGLPVRRYGPDELLAALGGPWEPLAEAAHVHTTPAGADQAFTWVAARRPA